jgi:hypothetical protein
MTRNLRVWIATLVLILSVGFTVVTRVSADDDFDIVCDSEQCTLRSDGCVWCCPRDMDYPGTCRYVNTAPPCTKDTSSC